MIKFLIIAILATNSINAGEYVDFTGCDYFQNLNPGQIYDIFSPGYPEKPYLPGTNCRWRAVAPNCGIVLSCFDMRLPQNFCIDRLEISVAGIYNDTNPKYACYNQTITERTGSMLVLALRSQGAATGYFRCQIVAQPYSSSINFA